MFLCSPFVFILTVVKYYTEMAASLGIKSVSTVSEIESAIVKAYKRRANIEKQEKATNPHVYLQPFETMDVWNHVHLCHTISENGFERKEQIDQVRAAITSDAKVRSSPIIISGGIKTGKTFLCSQIPKIMGEDSVSIVRFCGLTELTKTLPKLLRGISKHLHLLYGSTILPRSVGNSNFSAMIDLFKSILTEVHMCADKPVVLVLDSLESLAETNANLNKFITLCMHAIPVNISLVVSVRVTDERSEFFNDLRLVDHKKNIESILDNILSKSIL